MNASRTLVEVPPLDSADAPPVIDVRVAQLSFAEVAAQVRTLRQRVALIEHLQTTLLEQFSPRGELFGETTHVLQLGAELVVADEGVIDALFGELSGESQKVRERLQVLTRTAFTMTAMAQPSTLFSSEEAPSGQPSLVDTEPQEGVIPNPIVERNKKKKPG